jgi:hypothetical protein
MYGISDWFGKSPTDPSAALLAAMVIVEFWYIDAI